MIDIEFMKSPLFIISIIILIVVVGCLVVLAILIRYIVKNAKTIKDASQQSVQPPSMTQKPIRKMTIVEKERAREQEEINRRMLHERNMLRISPQAVLTAVL